MPGIAADQRVDCLLGTLRRLGDDPVPSLQHLVNLKRDDGHQQVALVLVIVIDGADRHLGGGGYGFHLHRLVAEFAEQLGRRFENAVVTVGFLLLPKA